MTSKNLDDLIEGAIDFARTVLVGVKDATLLPAWLIEGKTRTSVVGTPFDGDMSKDVVADAIRKLLKAEEAKSYSFVSEAWVAFEDPKHPSGLQPAQRYDRREVVMVTVADRTGAAKFRAWEIVRGQDGVVTELKANAFPGGEDTFEGRFHNLFEDE